MSEDARAMMAPVVETALKLLVSELELARRVNSTEVTDEDVPQGKDDAQIIALRAILGFLAAVGVDTTLRRPILDLLGEVGDRCSPGAKKNLAHIETMSILVAAVNRLNKRERDVQVSIATVARWAGVERNKLAKFRENTSAKQTLVKGGFYEKAAALIRESEGVFEGIPDHALKTTLRKIVSELASNKKH